MITSWDHDLTHNIITIILLLKLKKSLITIFINKYKYHNLKYK